MITDKGVSVWLNADLELLWSRVRHKNTRPLLRVAAPYEKLKELYEQRVPLYEQADLSVPAHPDYSIDTMAEQVLMALSKRADVTEKSA